MFRHSTRLIAHVVSLCCAAAVLGDIVRAQQPDFTREALDRRAPITAEHSYTMNAGVRMLLFWSRRDNVGSARITWRADGHDHRVLEMLVGSDPDRVPRGINRWGFIAEEVRPPNADLLGVMTQSDEKSVAEAGSPGAYERRDYRAIRTNIHGASVSGGTFRLSPGRTLTYRDLDELLELIPEDAPAQRIVPLAGGTTRGFLFAVEELLTRTLDPCRSASLKRPVDVAYVYNNTPYSLRLAACTFDPDFQIGDRRFSHVIHADLETRNASTGSRTPFHLTYGTEGDLKAVPLRIVFRPCWWFEAELVLCDSGPKVGHNSDDDE